MSYQLIHGDCLDVMAGMEAGSVDAVVTDPPYGLEFMGKEWDHGLPGVDFWTEALRLLPPSHYLLAFGGTRTWHRLACAIEDAGFEIRDTLMWLHGQGFPKNHDVAWAIHKEACITCGRMVEYDHDDSHSTPEAEHDLRFVRAAYLSTPVYACAQCGQVLQPFLSEQESPSLRKAWSESQVVWPEQPGVEGRSDLEAAEGQLPRCPVCTLSGGVLADGAQGWLRDGAPSRDGAIPWQATGPDGSRPSYRPQSREQLSQQPEALRIERLAQTSRGCGTALKPAYEPVILARKPPDGTIARSAIKHGLGALGIEECRISTGGEVLTAPQSDPGNRRGAVGMAMQAPSDAARNKAAQAESIERTNTLGRWPANVILDEVAASMVDEQTGERKTAGTYTRSTSAHGNIDWNPKDAGTEQAGFGDSGGPSRFFYCPKASRRERNAGLEGMEERVKAQIAGADKDGPLDDVSSRFQNRMANVHPTVKPVALMRWLVRLVAQPGDVVLDPFMGSGTTGVACAMEGRDFIGIEREAEYVEISRRRIEAAAAQERLPV